MTGGVHAIVGFHDQTRCRIGSSLNDGRRDFWPTGLMLPSETQHELWYHCFWDQHRLKGLVIRKLAGERIQTLMDFPLVLWLLKLCKKPRCHKILIVPIYFKFQGSSLLKALKYKLLTLQFSYYNVLFGGQTLLTWKVHSSHLFVWVHPSNTQIRAHPLWNLVVVPASCALSSALPSWACAPVKHLILDSSLSGLIVIHTARPWSQSRFTHCLI